jgi:hypothetical protein
LFSDEDRMYLPQKRILNDQDRMYTKKKIGFLVIRTECTCRRTLC